MKNKAPRKILSLLLALTLCVGMVGSQVFAAPTYDPTLGWSLGMSFDDIDSTGNTTYGWRFSTQLNDLEKIIYDAIDNQLYDYSSYRWNEGAAVDVTIKMDDLYLDTNDPAAMTNAIAPYVLRAADAYLMDNPEVYWLSKTVQPGITASGYQVKSITVSIASTVAQLVNAIAYFEEIADNAQKAHPHNGYQQLLYVHDAIAEHITYDPLGLTDPDSVEASSREISGAFAGKAVCEGYAKAFKVALDYLGFGNALVVGDIESGAHMWNMVSLDGAWYFVDVTNDDQPTLIHDRFLFGTDTLTAQNYTPDYSGILFGSAFGYPDANLSATDYDYNAPDEITGLSDKPLEFYKWVPVDPDDETGDWYYVPITGDPMNMTVEPGDDFAVKLTAEHFTWSDPSLVPDVWTLWSIALANGYDVFVSGEMPTGDLIAHACKEDPSDPNSPFALYMYFVFQPTTEDLSFDVELFLAKSESGNPVDPVGAKAGFKGTLKAPETPTPAEQAALAAAATQAAADMAGTDFNGAQAILGQFMADNGLDTAAGATKLLMAMEENPAVMAAYQALDAAANSHLDSNVISLDSYLDYPGMDASKVSAAGAALNALIWGYSDVALRISNPFTSALIPIADGYVALQLDINLNIHDIWFPINLTLPVPTGYDASKIVILHNTGLMTYQYIPVINDDGTMSFTVSQFSTFAITNPKPDPGPGPNPDPGPTYTTSSSSSSGGGGYAPMPALNAPKDVTRTVAQNAAKNATAAADGTLIVKLKNPGNITLELLQLIAKSSITPKKIQASSMDKDNRNVEVRITLDPSKSTKGLNLAGSTTDARVKSVKAKFEKFYTNKIAVISLKQKESFGQKVEIAAKADLKDMDTKNLCFYSYDSKTNSIKRIENPEYRIDSSGYVHFTTELAGDIIISEGPLAKK